MRCTDQGEKMDRQIALIGSGNAFFKDEGIGLYAVKYLKENFDFEPEISFIDGGTLGFGLMPLLQEYGHVLIVNTASEDLGHKGAVGVQESGRFLEGSRIKKTANEVEIAEMLQICSLSERMAETILISIVPEDIVSVEVGLSDTLIEAWPAYIDAILGQLDKLGVKMKRHEEALSLRGILHLFANPSIAHGRGF
jgi:hydrogenase maturation protease